MNTDWTDYGKTFGEFERDGLATVGTEIEVVDWPEARTLLIGDGVMGVGEAMTVLRYRTACTPTILRSRILTEAECEAYKLQAPAITLSEPRQSPYDVIPSSPGCVIILRNGKQQKLDANDPEACYCVIDGIFFQHTRHDDGHYVTAAGGMCVDGEAWVGRGSRV